MNIYDERRLLKIHEKHDRGITEYSADKLILMDTNKMFNGIVAINKSRKEAKHGL